MIEVIFLLVVIPKRMAELARDRGRSAVLWSLAGSGAWFGTEVILGLLFLLLLDSIAGFSDWGFAVFLVYLVPLVSGMVAFNIVRKRLEAIPTVPIESEEADRVS